MTNQVATQDRPHEEKIAQKSFRATHLNKPRHRPDDAYSAVINTDVDVYALEDGRKIIRVRIGGTLSSTPKWGQPFGGQAERRGVDVSIMPYNPTNSQAVDDLSRLEGRAGDRIFESEIGGPDDRLDIMTQADFSQVTLWHYAPKNINDQHVAQTTTGWSIGFDGKKLTGGISEQNVETRTYMDVELHDKTNGNWGRWYYEITGGHEKHDSFVPEIDTLWNVIDMNNPVNFAIVVTDRVELDNRNAAANVVGHFEVNPADVTF